MASPSQSPISGDIEAEEEEEEGEEGEGEDSQERWVICGVMCGNSHSQLFLFLSLSPSPLLSHYPLPLLS